MSAEKVIPMNEAVKETLRVEEVQLNENQQPVELRVIEQNKEYIDDEQRPYGLSELEASHFDLMMERRRLEHLEIDFEASRERIDFQNKAMMVGGSVAGAVSIAAILGYVRERKVHQQIIQLIEETAVLLAQEEADPQFVNFEQLVTHVFATLNSFEVRSWRHPFAIPAKELEKTTYLLVGMLRTAEQLGFNYANLDTANTIDVEAKE